jgi:glycerol-3-phosphate dehydrogenase (NAD(P)+)
MRKVALIGAGSWGCAQSRILGDNGVEVLLYDTDVQAVNQINATHTCIKLGEGFLPKSVSATTSLTKAMDFSDIIILCVPTKVIRSVIEQIAEKISSPKLFVNTSKGLEPGTFKRVSEIVSEVIPEQYQKGFVALTGPTHAEEVILQLPTCIVSVSKNRDYAKLIQELYSNQTYFRVYTGTDLIGSELCGAIKNIYALASGMLYGVGYGDNARAGMITRALVEMKRLVLPLGAKEDTLYGLTGVGDLVVTATSFHSRNFNAGVELAKGKNLNETLSSMPMVVEGARTVYAAYDLARKLQIDTPIIDAVYGVINHQQTVQEAVKNIMTRQLKEE